MAKFLWFINCGFFPNTFFENIFGILTRENYILKRIDFSIVHCQDSKKYSLNGSYVFYNNFSN